MILDAYLNAFAKDVPEGRWLVRAGPLRRHRPELVDDAERANQWIRTDRARSRAPRSDDGRHGREARTRLTRLTQRTRPLRRSRLALQRRRQPRHGRTCLVPIPKRAPAFAFLDPEGSELEWRHRGRIAEHKRGHSPYKVEQLILFPTDMGFVRLAPDHPELVTRIYGHDRWKLIYERRSAKTITAEQARSEYVRLYAEGLANLGYRNGAGPADQEVERLRRCTS